MSRPDNSAWHIDVLRLIWRQRYAYAMVILIGVCAVISIHQNKQDEIALALQSWRNDNDAKTMEVATGIESQFNHLHQGLRTLARLPGIRGIDRHVENFTGDARVSAQEIYNNLAHNVSISEVYIIPVDFDPFAIDATTGKFQEPIATFDERIVGQTADGGKSINAQIEEIEAFEYAEMAYQLSIFKDAFPREAQVDYANYPAIASREIITCDNSFYSASHPDDADRSGIIYSVPFYGMNGELKGMVSAVILTHAIRNMLPNHLYTLSNAVKGYTVSQAEQGQTEEVRQDQLYAVGVPLETKDISGTWILYSKRPGAAFWQQMSIEAIRNQTYLFYLLAFFAVFGAIALLVIHDRRSLRALAMNRELEERVEARTHDLALAKAEAERAMAEAERSNRAKSEFLATMSHELRTPMNGVLGMVGLLQKTELDLKQKHFAERIRESAQSLLGLLNNLLDISKIEAGKIDLEIADFQLSNVLHEVEAIMHSRALEKNLSLVTHIAPDTPRVLKGDFGRIRQILYNLVGNAIKFTATGGITIEVSSREIDDDQCLLRFEVRDTGIGIHGEKLNAVFERFVQADNTTSRLYGGTGLGLAICRDLAILMGGRIGVESEVGRGSIFWFTVACERSQRQALNFEAEGHSRDDPRQVASNRPLRILLAEDNLINQEIAVATLEHAGHHVDVVENGRDAVHAAQSVQYDVVLMDIFMPLMDGIVATKEIRRLPGLKSMVPIIALTANAMNGDNEKYITAGMDAYASKPFDPDRLFVLIQDCIAKRKANMDSGMDEPRAIKLAESTPASGLDPSVTEPMRSGKRDLWQRLIAIYSKTAAESMAMLERALSEGDGATVSMTAHSLKSSSANMGAARLSYLLNQLETMARNANLEPAQDLMSEIRGEFDLVSLALASEGQSAPLTSRASA